MQPVLAQILSVQDAVGNPLHIKLDNTATVSYVTLNEAMKHIFNINPKSQSFQLGGGVTIN